MIAKGLDEILERWVRLFEAAKLMGLEREERRLQAGEDGGEKNQDADDQQKQSGHRPARRALHLRRKKCMRAGLPLISDAVRLPLR